MGGKRLQEIREELQSVLSGSTVDAFLPPIAFVLFRNLLGLGGAAILSIGFSIFLAIVRLMRRQKWQYAFGGFAGVVLASGLAYVAGNAANYFIPRILTSLLIFLTALLSNLAGKPLAAWASHLSRGWTLDWFWRNDVKPAYREVTWFWTGLFLIRFLLFLRLYFSGNLWGLAWANVLLGLPFTVGVLVASYVYGLWRLRRLGGPGIEEYDAGKQAPWKGQTRGF